MTDRGLTDLIAAHQVMSQQWFPAGAEYRLVCKCGIWMGADAFPAHVALVVEQHTNGRITELAANIQHLSNNLDVARMGRATAEATIARVIEGAQMLVESFQRVERGGNHLYDASTHRCADNLALLLAEAQGQKHLRAALEGES